MNFTQGSLDRTQLLGREKIGREDLRNVPGVFGHRMLQDLAHLVLLQTFCQRVNRQDFPGRIGGSVDPGNPRVNEFPAEPPLLRRAGHDQRLPSSESLQHVRLVEPDGATMSLILPQQDSQHRPPVGQVPLLEILHFDHHAHGNPFLQAFDRPPLGQINIIPGETKQQIPHGPQP